MALGVNVSLGSDHACSGSVDMVQEMTELTMAMFFEAMFGTRAGDGSMRRAGQALQRSQRILGLHVLLSGFPDWVPRPMASALRSDLDPKAFSIGTATRTLFAKAEIVLWRKGVNDFHIEVWRSFAEYLHGQLEQAAREYVK